uniref:Adenylate kinase n=1 Tax=Meloidogyne javanica TaxID=6303 RepID=A0A915LQL3_MELJA
MFRGQTSGREDDNEETIRNRLRTFYEATKPVVEYYEGKGKLAKINAEGTINDIFAEICRANRRSCGVKQGRLFLLSNSW